MKEIKNMDKSRKKSAVLFECIFVVLGMWMMLSVHCQAAETNNDEKMVDDCIQLFCEENLSEQ